MTKTMNAVVCKDKFYTVLDEVADTGDSIVLMRNGKPIARIRPYTDQPSRGKKGPIVERLQAKIVRSKSAR